MTVGRWPYAIAAPSQNGSTRAIFDNLDQPRQGRLRHIQRFCGLGDGTKLGYYRELHEMLGIHVIDISYANRQNQNLHHTFPASITNGAETSPRLPSGGDYPLHRNNG